MVSLKEACSMVTTPNLKIVSCYEYDDIYEFSVTRRNWNGSIDDMPNGSIMTVKKDDGTVKNYGGFTAVQYRIDKGEGQTGKKVDVAPYVSEEDARFIKNIEEQKAKKRGVH